MLMYLLILSGMFSMMFIFLNHPLSLGCILLIQTTLISLASGLFYYNFWYSYILFLIMIGGMLVMFIYMTSIASNEKFKLPKKMLIYSSMMMIILMTMIFMLDNFFNIFLINLNNFNQSNLFINFTFNKFFNTPNMQMMIFLMIYLLITLIASVKIVGKNFGTLRQK